MNDSPSSESADQIRREMAQTRAEMSRTIGELQRRLDPVVLKEHAKDAAYEATIGKARDMVQDAGNSIKRTGNGFVQTIKDNPVPAAMAVLGIGWLVMRARSAPSYYEVPTTTYRVGAPQPEPGMKERVQGAVARMGDKADELKSDVKERAGDVADRAQELAQNAQMQIRDVAHQAQVTGRRASDAIERTFSDNPLAVGLAVVGVGLAIGLALPITEREDEWLGRARDNLVDKAQNAAQGALQQVRDTAQKVDQVAGQLQPQTPTQPNGIAADHH